jgi:hypothetical protein
VARDEDIERRLQNWARMRLGETRSPLGYAQAQLGAVRVDGGSGWDTPVPIPTNEVEAADTDQAVKALDSRLRRTVEVVYLEPGGIRRKAQQLACSEATVHQRVGEAHHAIQRWLADLATTRRQQRERMAALQRAGKF